MRDRVNLFLMALVVVNALEAAQTLELLQVPRGSHVRPGFGNLWILLLAALGLFVGLLSAVFIRDRSHPLRLCMILAFSVTPLFTYLVAVGVVMDLRDLKWSP
jgi:hypothetical protein